MEERFSTGDIVARLAVGADDMATVRRLFAAYQSFLNVDLCFQDFQAELDQLPGKYAPPKGCILLAEDAARGEVAGCVALWPRDVKGFPQGAVCEMKRLYVRPEWRGEGVGRLLAEAILHKGRRLGYQQMVLDTLVHLTEAVTMYRKLGFTDCASYYDNPLPGVLYMGKAL